MTLLAARPVRIGLALVSVLCWVAVAVLGTLRLTVLNPRFDSAALTRVDAYNRLYTQVLPTPRVAALVRSELAGLPVDPQVVADNIPLLLPPATLQRVAEVELSQLTGYLIGDLPRLDLAPGLQPVQASLRRLLATTVADDLAGLPGAWQTKRALLTGVDRVLAELAAGRLPRTLPRLPLGEPLAGQAAALLVGHAAHALRPQLFPPVRAALEQGQLTRALSLAAPILMGNGRNSLAAGLQSLNATLAAPLSQLRHRPSVALIRELRPATSASDPGTLVAIGLLGAAGALALAWTSVPGRRRRRTGQLLLCAGFATVGIGAALALTLPDPLTGLAASKDIPGPAASLVSDVNAALVGGVRNAYAGFALALLLAGGVLLGFPGLLALLARGRLWSVAGARHLARALGPIRAAGAGAALAAVVAGFIVLPAATAGGAPPQACDGYAALCDRPYNRVVQLASHNATSASADGFFGSEQDTDFVTQLNSGVRALLIDTRYWKTPRALSGYLRLLPDNTADRVAPLTTGLTSAHPGVWLCHDTCTQGALSAPAAFRRLARWLAAHRDEVVTLIVQDHTDPADTMFAVLAGGLGPYLATPPPSPNGPWPTLGQLVRSGRRLFVFSERHDVTGTWYRAFYRYAAETPWDQRSASHMSCAPARGGSKAGLFLINDFVIAVAPSRWDAAVVNDPAFLLRRVGACERIRRMRPTFIAVDFTDIGAPLAAVNQLNGVGRAADR